MQSASDISRGSRFVWANAEGSVRTAAKKIPSRIIASRDWAIGFNSSNKPDRCAGTNSRSVVIHHSHPGISRGCRSFQTIRDGSPFTAFRGRFDHDQFRSGLVAPVQLCVQRTGESFGIVRDDADTRETGGGWNAGVGEDVGDP